MAGLFADPPSHSVRLLDAGAGVGSLTAAYVEWASRCEHKPAKIHAIAYERDENLQPHLSRTLSQCAEFAGAYGIEFTGEARQEDFIGAAVSELSSSLFSRQSSDFNAAILNPPYRKLRTDSEHRRLLRTAGIETSNLYAAFVALAAMLLAPKGELVAITPRSFCNGPYFKAFRALFLREMSLTRIHIFNSRKAAFSEYNVLQENIIFRAVKSRERANVLISSSDAPDMAIQCRSVPQKDIIRPDDPDKFIHIVLDDRSGKAAKMMGRAKLRLEDLGLSVSTGPVVAFRSRQWLREEPTAQTVPLIYPKHFQSGVVSWPREDCRKPQAFQVNPASARWLVPSGIYVLTKRFSSKEEKRRVVAVVFDPEKVKCDQVAFENHVNYFHCNGKGMTLLLARGLSAYLNSTLVDTCFRNFNGHTQVNATDLRKLRYPTREQLERLGRVVGAGFQEQTDLDQLITQELLSDDQK